MNKISDFVRKERLYLLLLAFVILLNITAGGHDVKKHKASGPKAGIEAKSQVENPFVKREEIEAILAKNKNIAVIYTISSFLIFLVLILGLALDVILLPRAFYGKSVFLQTYQPEKASWNAWDVARVTILFLFFGYMITMTESALVRVFPLLRDQNFRMVANTSLLDILTIVFILYFTVGQYGEKLVNLGISAKNFFRNVFYGIVGYVATIPVLVAILIATALFTYHIKYVPERQVVVQLFMKEKGALFLLYTSLFAAVAGPIIEELFFRGFMYSAFKKYMNRFTAMCVTGALFAALHAHPVGFLPIMVLGVVLAYMYEKTGTLVSSMTIHITHNLTMVYLVFLSRSMGS